MRRVLAILAFFTGMAAAEMATPAHCSMLHASCLQLKRRKG
jgi:hypothetical protein